MFTLVCLVAAAGCFGCGGWFVFRGRRGRAAADDFLRHGIVIPARVVEMRSRFVEPSFHRETSTRLSYFPVVEFALGDGRIVQAESMSGATPAPAKVGETVDVVFHRDDPTRVSLLTSMARPGAVSWAHQVLGVVICCFGGVVIAFWALLKLVLGVPI
ncbi:DUF3592 domain-containing protein [Nocardioides sp. AE5]|uniref:DUF3592 domain-containing protein n=1 Tax=Nocardioides sp. AE5 TaxID=2962573 RepID=UPI0028827495|nr:DUF3592 domain-containing protein [Nocardioides sp. AE5]MDT0201957.1 DUF3592 domain-containing protein [Nocardioides sp. AE5]